MADNTVVHMGENSPEEIAYKLMNVIGHAEGKRLHLTEPKADRNWILDTYAECLRTVKDPFGRR